MEFVNEKEYEHLRFLYQSSNEVINEIINKIFEIGTRDLYSSIVNGSTDTLIYLAEIEKLMRKNDIPLPDVNRLGKFSILENEGWGRAFTKEDIF